MTSAKENRPGLGTGAEDLQAMQSGSSVAHLPQATDAKMLARAEAIVVLVADRRGRYRRRVFLTLKSAERAVAQAAARGVDAQVVLCRLSPVEGGELP